MNLAKSFEEEFNYQVKQLKRFTTHGPSLGRFVEILFIKLLKKYFPKSIDFSSGFIYSMNPTKSKKVTPQIDVICYDRINYPVLFDCNEIVVIPPKSMKGAIEIKSRLSKTALNQFVTFSNSSILKETPTSSKLSLLALKSEISPEYVCNYFTDFYKNNPILIRQMGCIYCLNWKEILVFNISEKEHKYELIRLNNFDLGMSSFMNFILMDLYGKNVYLSIANEIGPSLFIPIKKYELLND